MGKQYVVKGAMAQCNQSKVPMIAQLQLIPDNMFVNMNGNPVATNMSLGPVFGPVPFGVCNMIPPTPAVPTPPCACVIASWSGAYTDVKINMVANPLTTDSKGMCVLGGSITFKTSGQFPKPSVPSIPVPAVGDMAVMENSPINQSGLKADILKLRSYDLNPNLDISKVNENVKQKLMANGLDEKDISRLIDLNRKACDTNNPAYDDMRETCRKISEKSFPLPKVGDTVTKLITPGQFDSYHLQSTQKSYIGNCIGKADEYSETPDLDGIIVDYGLDYLPVDSEGKRQSPFTDGYVKIYAKIRNEEQEKMMTRPFDPLAMKNPGPPQTKSGILGHERADKLTPEYHTAGQNIYLDDGDYACVYDNDGNLTKKYIYVRVEDGDENISGEGSPFKWVEVKL